MLKKLQPECTVVVIAQSKRVEETSAWADFDASSMTNMVDPLPAAKPVSRVARPVSQDADALRSGSRERDAASSRSGSKMPLLIGGAVFAAGLIVAAVFIIGKKSDTVEPPAKREQVAKGDQNGAPKESPGKPNHRLVFRRNSFSERTEPGAMGRSPSILDRGADRVSNILVSHQDLREGCTRGPESI